MKFQPGQNQIVVRQGLKSTTYVKDSFSVQVTPQPPVEEVINEPLIENIEEESTEVLTPKNTKKKNERPTEN